MLISRGFVGQDEDVPADQWGTARAGYLSTLALVELKFTVRDQARRPAAFDLTLEHYLLHVLQCNLRNFPEPVQTVAIGALARPLSHLFGTVFAHER